MSSQKTIASLSLDLDNRWSYLKTHGDPGWQSLPSYLDVTVPRVLEFLAARDLRITFFVVGRDAAEKKNHASIKAIAGAGHEIGNHSFSHDPWLNLYDQEKVEAEIAAAEEQIASLTGQRPVGFRGPGYSFSETTLRVLERRGYLYDASTFPTFFGPLARFYYFLNSNLTRKDLKQRRLLFGSAANGFRPLKPYRWTNIGGLLEIPVTTMPLFRAPIHFSYVLYLSTFSVHLALAYFRTAMALCRMTGVSPSLLLHPLDFLGEDDNVGLEFFPAMRLPSARKMDLVSKVLELCSAQLHFVPLKEHAQNVAKGLQTAEVTLYSHRTLPGK